MSCNNYDDRIPCDCRECYERQLACDRALDRANGTAGYPPQRDNADPIKPTHYQGKDGMQVFDVIEAFGLNYNLGTVAAYICRAGKKGDALDDLRKAAAHLQREIEIREKARAS